MCSSFYKTAVAAKIQLVPPALATMDVLHCLHWKTGTISIGADSLPNLAELEWQMTCSIVPCHCSLLGAQGNMD
jgi:hypothetical protein